MQVVLRSLAYVLISFRMVTLVANTYDDIPTGQKLYQQMCASCHGIKHEGGLGGSLVTDGFKQVGKSIGFLDYVKKGNLSVGMPSFEAGLSDAEILSIAHYIAHLRQNGIDAPIEQAAQPNKDVEMATQEVGTGDHRFKVEEVFSISGTPWAIAFFPDDDGGLITTREGELRLFKDDELEGRITGTPKVVNRGQGGLLEVYLHPDYAENGWIYLAFSHEKDGRNMTKIVRGKLNGTRWGNEEDIFEAPSDTYLPTSNHFGTRIVIHDGYLFFGIGDRGRMRDAQDLSKPNGKIHRIHDDGRVPSDNPFVRERDALETIWAYGIRNPQGLDLHPFSGEVWESEHGPRGGDEINLIEQGKNYGWPEITHGVAYSGEPISDRTHAPGMEQPKHFWTPSIAVCGIDFYEGDAFPNWKNNLFAGGLSSNELHRLIIKDGEVVDTEIILDDEGRIRDIASAPDGYLYLVLNGQSRVVRLVPR